MRDTRKTWSLIVAGFLLGAGVVAILYDPRPAAPPVVLPQANTSEPNKALPWPDVRDADSNYGHVMSALMLLVQARRELAAENLQAALTLSRRGEADLLDLLSDNPWLLDQLSRAKLIEASILEKMGRIPEMETARFAFLRYSFAYLDVLVGGAMKSQTITVQSLYEKKAIELFRKPGRKYSPIREPGVPRLHMCTNDSLDSSICRGTEG